MYNQWNDEVTMVCRPYATFAEIDLRLNNTLVEFAMRESLSSADAMWAMLFGRDSACIDFDFFL